ncbi:MAG: pyridoxal-phosphate dependent enzyme [Candidatus Marinimicrobia bacterium]|jgi:cysteine synthase|nr:pyridoxal-phosphate dependent enzyme [Candidatus Neomarinimicrobiota bacterium]MBT3633749.1 pyridoxal-phosphate dependent enzyme [Candidatus Neomarinimicrobiota bacterium]MBT3682541.1 pyridoxal-phosphate dependent enzyme [Candidatus Neomarinimicrobiota bacterium]MBT3759305.1 pyridoxal-phosphate dependent enzyme [Candidatus Neomarinimicrobiota bacterium]MBT3894687.1 pyridoxal-phosphate dependent enzyme [Candidatus Neomarinimicrobiota bacterium]
MNRQNQILENTINRCREKNIILPTYKQMANPELIPGKIKAKLKGIGLWDLDPLNLFRITWKNEPVENGGGYGDVNYLELPTELTGVEARIFVLLGKYFPTGAHKVGATFGPLVEKLITGKFDPTSQKALWPSTGNYCRGGAYDSYLLGCEAIAVLPEGMSRERFEWLETVGSEIFATPGSESNVKEIYDKVKELKAERGDKIVVLNQFEEIGNPMWHYAVTGRAMQDVFESQKDVSSRFSGLFLTQGSAGALGSGELLRKEYPLIQICAGEAIQCPTLLYNGYGAHRIEGIGDKHVPWIHNLKNMDMVAGIDDEVNIHLMRLFNEPEGHKELIDRGVDQNIVSTLHHFGISSIANIMGAIKMAKYYEWNKQDCIFTVATDSMEMYQSRLQEEHQNNGKYSARQAAIDFEGHLRQIGTDAIIDLTYLDKKRMHNLKYFTWVEQQGKTMEELDAQWYDDNYWSDQYSKVDEWDDLISEFNDRTGLLAKFT